MEHNTNTHRNAADTDKNENTNTGTNTTADTEPGDEHAPRPTPHPKAGITITQRNNTNNTAADENVLLTLNTNTNPTITHTWSELLKHKPIQRDILDAVLAIAAESETRHAYRTRLEELGITNNPTQAGYKSLAVKIIKRNPRDETVFKNTVWEFLTEIRKLAHGEFTDVRNAAALLRHAHQHRNHADTEYEETKYRTNPGTIRVKLDHVEFKHVPRQQRERVLRLINELGNTYTIEIVTPHPAKMTKAWLTDTHREAIPTVTDNTHTPQHETVVTNALQTISHDSAEATIINTLTANINTTRTYNELYGHAPCSKSRVRQAITRLEDLGVIETFGAKNEKRVTPLPPANEIAAVLTRDDTEQTTLQTSVNDTPKSERHTRVTRDRDSTRGKRRP